MHVCSADMDVYIALIRLSVDNNTMTGHIIHDQGCNTFSDTRIFTILFLNSSAQTFTVPQNSILV